MDQQMVRQHNLVTPVSQSEVGQRGRSFSESPASRQRAISIHGRRRMRRRYAPS